MAARPIGEVVDEFLEATRVGAEKLARRADLSTRTVQNVAAGKPHDPETASKLHDAMRAMWREVSTNMDALAGDLFEPGELDDAGDRLARRRARRR